MLNRFLRGGIGGCLRHGDVYAFSIWSQVTAVVAANGHWCRDNRLGRRGRISAVWRYPVKWIFTNCRFIELRGRIRCAFAVPLLDDSFVVLTVSIIIAANQASCTFTTFSAPMGYAFAQINDIDDLGTVVGQVEDKSSGAFVAFSRTVNGKSQFLTLRIQSSRGSAAATSLA